MILPVITALALTVPARLMPLTVESENLKVKTLIVSRRSGLSASANRVGRIVFGLDEISEVARGTVEVVQHDDGVWLHQARR